MAVYGWHVEDKKPKSLCLLVSVLRSGQPKGALYAMEKADKMARLRGCLPGGILGFCGRHDVVGVHVSGDINYNIVRTKGIRPSCLQEWKGIKA